MGGYSRPYSLLVYEHETDQTVAFVDWRATYFYNNGAR